MNINRTKSLNIQDQVERPPHMLHGGKERKRKGTRRRSKRLFTRKNPASK